MSGPAWNAAAYRDVSSVQLSFARELIALHEWAGDERVLDAGCGTGALGAEILDAHPGVRLVAVDNDPGMIAQARQTLQGRDGAEVLLGDVMALPRVGPFDLVVSNAVLHWVPDHDAACASIHRVLAPGGRLLANCGGAGNLAGVHAIAARLMAEPPFARHAQPVPSPWNHQDDRSTRGRLSRAGFNEVRVRLEPRPIDFPDRDSWERFLRVVTLRVYLHALPARLHDGFLSRFMERAEAQGLGCRLDFVRLAIDARR